MIKAVGFDLGETLIYYPGIPLSWQTFYREALTQAAETCQLTFDDHAMALAESILARYNTRLNPRSKEVSAAQIFTEILNAADLPLQHLDPVRHAFFRFFQRKALVYEDAIPTLQWLHQKNLKLGILTDVPYGMDRFFVEQDMVSFSLYVDLLLTSVDVGIRKPEPGGYLELAHRLGVLPSEMAYVGNEPKDIEGAKQAGMLAILVNRTGRQSLAGQDLEISSLCELQAVLSKFIALV
jgi:putative hydrolase of the HAD superfamily